MKITTKLKNLGVYESKLPKLSKGRRNLGDRNHAYSKLSKKHQRCEIALDVIDQLDADNIKASCGAYWSSNLSDDDKLYDLVEELDIIDDHHEESRYKTWHKLSSKGLQEVMLRLPETQEECQVCAIGAAMMSQIRLGNSIESTGDNLDDIESGKEEYSKAFTQKMLRAMEFVYERAQGGAGSVQLLGITSRWFNEPEYKMRGKVYTTDDFPFRHNTKKNLMNIFLNVLANNGNFKIHDYTNYLEKYKIQL